MNVLLLCGYRERDPHEEALAAEAIDRRILELQHLGFTVICVLAGAQADQQLRVCRRIVHCELVFDTQNEPNLATNLRAGIFANDGSGCFVLPVEAPCPPPEVWHSLRETWRKNGFHTDTNVYQLIDQQGAPSHFGFPLLVTRSGNTAIRKMQGFRSLLDTRLKYLLLSPNRDATLASAAFPL